jgi:cell division protease FtsH
MGRSFGGEKNFSEQTQDKIDAEVALIMAEATKRAEATLKVHRNKLDAIAEKLLKEETIEGPEFVKLFESIDKVKKKDPKGVSPVTDEV